jgi:uncharacterized membrane protein
MDKKKKTLFIVLGIVEVAILIFSLVISIIVSSTIKPDKTSNLNANGQFIGTLQNSPVLFFCAILLPVLIIFLGDGAYLIVYASKKQMAIGDAEKQTIEDEAKRQAREEVLKEMKAEQSAQKEQTEKPSEIKPEEPKK